MILRIFLVILVLLVALVLGYVYLLHAPETVIMAIPGIEIPTIAEMDSIPIKVRSFKDKRTLIYPDGHEEEFKLTDHEFWDVVRKRSESLPGKLLPE